MFYFAKTPTWLQFIFPAFVWKISKANKKIFLTFDDGPHPVHTHFVLDELKKYNAKATFFCIGNNVQLFPSVYNRIINEGHSVGNHTYNHLKGRKTSDSIYLNDVKTTTKYIESVFFRPPYGSIKNTQTKLLQKLAKPFKIIMWTVLSGDFDIRITKEKCLKNVLMNTTDGSIVVFHDSEKAGEKMRYVLPIMLKHFSEKGYLYDKITIDKCL